MSQDTFYAKTKVKGDKEALFSQEKNQHHLCESEISKDTWFTKFQ